MFGKKTERKYRKRYSAKASLILFILLFLLGMGAWFIYEIMAIKPADEWFESKASNGGKVSLPEDDAPHQAKMEWWYYNGHLTTESGKRFSFHYTTFIVTDLISHLVKHVSLSDHQTNQRFTDQRRTTVGIDFASATSDGFDFKMDNWTMTGKNGHDQLVVATNQFSFNLTLTSTLPPVLHGEEGIILLEQAGSSYYYSRTRMAISGTVKIGKKIEAVKGIAWFDHQWGDFTTNQLSWDWFSLQLDSGEDVMLYQLRDKSDNPILYTGSVTQNGITEVLSSKDFTLIPGKKWTSKKTGIGYPISWTIQIPKWNMDIKTHGLMESSEFDAMLSTYNIYWEGAVKIEGTHTGTGFMELYGYGDKKK